MPVEIENFHFLFRSFAEARNAYLRLAERSREHDLSDVELAGDADYRMLFQAGRRIESIGGRSALEAAIEAFFPEDSTRTAEARRHLNHWWAGFGTWREAPQRLH